MVSTADVAAERDFTAQSYSYDTKEKSAFTKNVFKLSYYSAANDVYSTRAYIHRYIPADCHMRYSLCTVIVWSYSVRPIGTVYASAA